jgi:predicted nuclease of predicted toxin-antitoxin system
MSIAVLVDMNLSVEWIPVLAGAGWPSLHWSKVGDPCAEDATIMAWARNAQHVIFTHDLDFGTALALSKADGPSVIQVRGQKVLPEQISAVVIAALHKYEAELERGALVVVDEKRSRVRILPIK